jgi:hypothetical protein
MPQHPEGPPQTGNKLHSSGEDRLRHALRRVRVFPRSPRRIRILEIIRDSCSLEDLRNLCFYLGIDYDVLPGDRKMAKARSLIHHYERRDALDDLVSQLHRIRPDLEGDL